MHDDMGETEGGPRDEPHRHTVSKERPVAVADKRPEDNALGDDRKKWIEHHHRRPRAGSIPREF